MIRSLLLAVLTALVLILGGCASDASDTPSDGGTEAGAGTSTESHSEHATEDGY